jgi:membrane associated rhomboid family serine protease
VLTISLIVANVLVFLTEPLTAGNAAQARFFYCKAAIPYEVITRHQLPATIPVCPGKNVWFSIVLSMFLHGGLLHIAGNMLFLWVFGNNIEDRLGRGKFVAFYLVSGLAATYAQSAIAMAGQSADPVLGSSAATPMVGASGAVAGILGAYLLLFPRARVTTLVFLFLFVTTMDVPAAALIGLWFLLQVFSGVASIGASASSGVAFFAHIGGFLAGMLLLALLRPKPPPQALPPTYY